MKSEEKTFYSSVRLAEKYMGISPYVYCEDNSLRFTDPNGKELSQQELEAQMVARINKELELSKHKEENRCTMGARCMSKEFNMAHQLLIKLHNNKRLVKMVFHNAIPISIMQLFNLWVENLKKEVRAEQFEELEGLAYYCEGYIGENQIW